MAQCSPAAAHPPDRRCRIRRELVPTARGIELAIFDLADLPSVRAWAQRAQDFGLPLDVLVNNAGSPLQAPSQPL